MNYGHLVAIGTADEIIQKHGSGERLEIHGSEELANYIKKNTDLKVEYNGNGLVSVSLKGRIDALAALAAAEQSGLEWGEIRTRRDSLEDVFMHLVSGIVDEHGEIKAGNEGSRERWLERWQAQKES